MQTPSRVQSGFYKRPEENEMSTMTKRRKPREHAVAADKTTTIKCAFCSGTGREPYRILSRISDCPVCKGHKAVEVKTPVVACLYCKGTGRQRHTRLTCSACRGAGVITLPGPTAACPQCRGGGRERETDLPCSLCKGAGLVAKRSGPTRGQLVTAEGRQKT